MPLYNPATGGSAATKPQNKIYLATGIYNPIATNGSAILNQISGGTTWSNTSGLSLNSTAATNSMVCLCLDSNTPLNYTTRGWWGPIYNRNFSLIMQCGFTINDTCNMFLGMGTLNAIPGASDMHVGFKCLVTGSGGSTLTWYASVGNGTAQTEVDVSAAINGDPYLFTQTTQAIQNFVIKFTPASVAFYYNDALLTTITTTIPSGSNTTYRDHSLMALLLQTGTTSSNQLGVLRFLIEADAIPS
jgi:hypothetical protein